MKYLRNCLFITLFVLIIMPSNSYSSDSAPYTEEAANKLAIASKKISPPLVEKEPVSVEEKKEQGTKFLYKYYKEWFNQAGYSFDKSIVQLSKDLEKNPNLIENNPLLMGTGFVLTYAAANQFAELNKQVGLSSKVLPKATIEAIYRFANIMDTKQKLADEKEKQKEAIRQKEKAAKRQQEEEEHKKIEAENLKKEQEELRAKELKRQERLKSIPGHYEELQGSKKYGGVKKYGEMNIQILSDGSIMFSGYKNMMGQLCKFESKKASLEEYDDYRDVYIAIFEEINDKADKDAPNNCRLEMKFGKYSEDISAQKGMKYFLEIKREEGLCRTYCERGGDMMGRYDKVEQTASSNQTQPSKNQSPEQSQNPENSKSEEKGLDDAIRVFKGIFGGK